jgi:P2-related tail formation protein
MEKFKKIIADRVSSYRIGRINPLCSSNILPIYVYFVKETGNKRRSQRGRCISCHTSSTHPHTFYTIHSLIQYYIFASSRIKQITDYSCTIFQL